MKVVIAQNTSQISEKEQKLHTEILYHPTEHRVPLTRMQGHVGLGVLA